MDLDDPRRLAWIHGTLIRAVARLALDADGQRAYLEAIGTAGLADELALELGEAALLMDQLEDAGWVSEADAALVRRIGALLDAMGGALWDPGVLATAPEWAAVRAAARRFIFRTEGVVRVPQR
ncbi:MULTISPECIES: hypothetical protein [Catenuloplanes]|uniref:Uncharacterized protein n=1 Tax=Catenuloplanes niger TaxID=587534 RepID=A0AAE3ZSS3_9ACTN|nr:hypothetical protein [Catenuloplanes niger]MDR7325413.1 hypothetical protein [Catenuloplanes niger]